MNKDFEMRCLGLLASLVSLVVSLFSLNGFKFSLFVRFLACFRFIKKLILSKED